MDFLHSLLDFLKPLQPFLTPAAIVVIGLVAYRGVKKQIGQHELTAQLQTTFRTILEHEFHDPHWRECNRIAWSVLEEHKDETDQDALAAAVDPSPEDKERRRQTLIFLNYYELVAVGIRKKAVHEDLYKIWFKTGYITTWKKSKVFVDIWRKPKNDVDVNNEPTYENFEHVADRWKHDKPVEPL